jgi:hypothetical protein
MCAGSATALIVAGAAVAGGAVSGAVGKSSTAQGYSGIQSLSANTQLQNNAYLGMYTGLQNTTGLAGAGAGQAQVSNALNSQQNLAAAYNQYAQNGGLPDAQQMGLAQGYAQSVFAPQQTALQQSMIGATANEQQQAAALGRQTNDPVLQAKLQLGYMQQSQQLQSQQGAFASQMGLQIPQMQLQAATQGNQLQQQLAAQAFSNQANVFGMGQQALQNQQQFQLATATRFGSQQTQSGGGVTGAISGGLGGLGAGLSTAAALKNAFSGSVSPTSFSNAGGSMGAFSIGQNSVNGWNTGYGNFGTNASWGGGDMNS